MSKNNNIISNWLQKNKNPEIDKFVEKNLAITEKIYAILEEKKLTPTDLAKKLGKSPSEISKWLSGNHNLTIKTITKIETVLDCEIMHIEPQTKYVYLTVKLNEKETVEEETKFEPSLYTKNANGFY